MGVEAEAWDGQTPSPWCGSTQAGSSTAKLGTSKLFKCHGEGWGGSAPSAGPCYHPLWCKTWDWSPKTQPQPVLRLSGWASFMLGICFSLICIQLLNQKLPLSASLRVKKMTINLIQLWVNSFNLQVPLALKLIPPKTLLNSARISSFN